MGLFQGFAKATILAKIAFVLIILTNFINCIAFTTTGWGKVNAAGNDDYWYGLWRRCREVTRGCDFLDGYAKVWYGVVQGFASLGFAGGNVAFFIIICYVVWWRCQRDREAALGAGFMCLLSSVCYLVAIIVYGIEFERDGDVSPEAVNFSDGLHYSFGLAVVTCAMLLVVGFIMIVEAFYKRGKKYSPDGEKRQSFK